MRKLSTDGILKGQIGWWLERDGAGGVRNLIRPGAYDGALVGGASPGVSWTDSPYGQAMQFDGGANAYIDLGPDALLDADTPFTLMWLERTDTSSGARGLFCFSPSDSSQRFVVFRYDTAASPGYHYLTCAQTNHVPDGVPHFVTAPTLASGIGKWRVWIITGSLGMRYVTAANVTSFKLMVDGVNYTATTGNTLSTFASGPNYIGWDSLDSKWLGAIRNVRLWGRVLSDEEKYRMTINPEAGLTSMATRRPLIPSLMTSSRLDRMFIAM